MSKKLINFNFNGEFIPELKTLKRNYSTSTVNTRYCTTAPSRMKEYATDTYLAEALSNYVGSIDTLHLFVAKTKRNQYVCEYKKSGKEKLQVCIATLKGDRYEFKAGALDNEGVLYQYEDGHKGTMFVMDLMPVIIKDSEAAGFVDTLRSFDVSEDCYSEAMCGLCNNIYYRIKDEKSDSPVSYVNEPFKISQSDLDSIEISKVYCGEPVVFSKRASEEYLEEDTEEEKCILRDLYPINEKRVLSNEEEERVPDLGDWYVVPNWAKTAAKRIANSQRFRKSIKNILLYGPSGTGKTEGSQAIAEMLGLPYYTITCSADDDKFDLIGQLIPNTKKNSMESVEDVCRRLDIPSFSEIENNFDESFKKLFGREPDKFDSEADAYEEVTKRICKEKGQDENDFTYVESELIQAIKNGGFCEIQEANIIKRSSVMEALNPLLAGGENGFIKLPTGEIIKRHPDTIISFTINRNYEGCSELQEAVLSRINYVKKIPEPTAEEMYLRTKAQTGFTNESLLKKMSEVIVEINEYCTEKDITGGVCGPRELIDWAQNTMLISDEKGELESADSAIEAAFETVLEKASQNEDDMEDIITGVFKKHFSPAKVEEIRKNL